MHNHPKRSEDMMNFLRKMILLAMVTMLLCGCAWAEGRVLGNEKTGYLTSTADYIDFESINVSAEEQARMAVTTGYCQYYCASGINQGMIITMMGFTDEQIAGTDVDSKVLALGNNALNSLASLYGGEIDYQAGNLVGLDGTHRILYILAYNPADPQNPNYMIAAVPYDGQGHYGLYYFEAFGLTNENLVDITALLKSVQF